MILIATFFFSGSTAEETLPKALQKKKKNERGHEEGSRGEKMKKRKLTPFL
jgi:hypothetical protein